MQVKQSTFDSMRRLGQIPAWADFSNPAHTKRAGEILASNLFDKYKGNVMQAAAAYYGGDKAVRPDGSIVIFGVTDDPKAPNTMEYATQINARMRS